MASCVCGAEIRWATNAVTQEKVPLEYHAELGPGENRYIVDPQRADGSLLVTPVSPRYEGEAYKDHRIDCPDHGNGLVPG